MIYFRNYTIYRNFVKISFILCFIISYYTLAYVITGGINNLTLLYIALFAPLCIYCTRIGLKKHVLAIFIVYITTAAGVYYMNYIGFNDLSRLDEIQTILRPDEDRIDRLGISFRNGGYLGSCHDAANILSIIGIFLIANLLTKESKNKLFTFCCLLIGTPALLLTTSASNISTFLFTAIIMLLIFCRTFIRFSMFSAITITLIYLLYNFVPEDVFVFTNKFRFHGDTSDGGMFNALNESSVLSSFLSFFLGFAYTLELPIVSTELGIIKLLVQFGIFPFLLLIYFLVLPLLISLKNGINTHYFYYSFPLLTSLLSLLHYASLFRITSIGVLILLYSYFLVKYFNLDRPSYSCPL